MGKFKNLLIFIVGLIVGGLLSSGVFFFYKKSEKPISLSPQEAAKKAIDYINKNLLPSGKTASLLEVGEESGLYKFKIKIGEQEFDSFVSKDGKLLFPEKGINLESPPQKKVTTKPSKANKPDVKLFVMSYCPFGLQMEKAYLPVYKLLKDKANMGIYFVNYTMHGKKETEENLRQYCIEKEQNEKYYDYLSCFVKEGNYKKCLKEAKVDQEKLKNCISETDKKYKISQSYPNFPIYDDLNKKYGVRGSPTVVINDQVVEISPRSPENFKEAVCNAFTSPPPECSQKLSEKSASPGFGLKEGGSGGGQCQ